MKVFSLMMMCLTAVATLAAVQASATETECRNIVQGQDAKNVNCSQLSGAARTQCENRNAQQPAANAAVVH